MKTTESPDLDQFFAEIERLGIEHRRAAGEEDLKHLSRFERIGWASFVAGLASAGLPPNPLTASLLSQGATTRWMLMHHIGHRGYDRIDNVPARWTSKVFGRGRRRVVDWLDWIPPDAWHVEHDLAHHYHLGEPDDPDALDRNTAPLRATGMGKRTIQAIVAAFAGTWTLTYYGPRTIAVLRQHRKKERGINLPTSVQMFDPRSDQGRETWRRVVAPNGAIRFVALPLLFLPFGRRRVRNALFNMLLAELLRNLHTFLVITPSHTAADLQRFEAPAADRREFLLRQIVGSANYRVGGDVFDFAHMWLNYQIEHHVWPDLSMLQYRLVQPKLKALCEEYGIPYVQEPVWKRLRRTLRVLDGTDVMPVAQSMPGFAEAEAEVELLAS